MLKFKLKPINDSPVIVRQLNTPEYNPDEVIKLSLDLLEIADVDSKDFTIQVLPGNEYEVKSPNELKPSPTVKGTFEVNIKVSDGELSTSEFKLKVFIRTITGIEDEHPRTFVPYPNPTKGLFYFACPNERTEVTITDASGKAQPIHTTYRDGILEVSLEQSAKGFYMMQVRLDGKKYYYKIVRE